LGLKKRKYDAREPAWADLRQIFPVLAKAEYQGVNEDGYHYWNISCDILENGDVVFLELELPEMEAKE
jgi:hypothetical protein